MDEDIGTIEELVEMYENDELENSVRVDNDCVFVYDKDEIQAIWKPYASCHRVYRGSCRVCVVSRAGISRPFYF